MTMSRFWKNKSCLITGGTAGLGRSLAQQLDDLGCKLALVARHQSAINETLNHLHNAIGIKADISDKHAIYPVVGEVQSKLGGVDILFNVASYLGETPLKYLIDTHCEDFEKVLQSNLLGPFRLCKALLPAMLIKGDGLIINISSDAAVNAYPKWGSYSASKAALDQMTRILDEELKFKGVRTLSIDPGDMNTALHFSAIPNANPEALRDPHDVASRIINFLAAEDYSQIRRVI